MNVISIDPGLTRTGVFVFIDGEQYSLCIDREKRSHYDQLVFIRSLVLSRSHGCDLGIVEDYSYGTSGPRLAYSIEVGAVVREALSAAGVPIIAMPIPTWKAITIGHHKKTTKEQQRAYLQIVMKRYGRHFSTVDEADAFLMYESMLEISKGEIKSKTADRIRAALQKVRDGKEQQQSKAKARRR